MDFFAFRRWRQGVLDAVGDDDPDDDWQLEEEEENVDLPGALPHRRVYGVRRDPLQDYTDSGFLETFG